MQQETGQGGPDSLNINVMCVCCFHHLHHKFGCWMDFFSSYLLYLFQKTLQIFLLFKQLLNFFFVFCVVYLQGRFNCPLCVDDLMTVLFSCSSFHLPGFSPLSMCFCDGEGPAELSIFSREGPKMEN